MKNNMRVIFPMIFLLSVAACAPNQVADTPQATLYRPPTLPPPTATIDPILLSSTPTAADLATVTAAPTEPFSTGLPFGSIRMFSADQGWAWGRVEGSHMHIWRTADGGRTWEDMTPVEEMWAFGDVLDVDHAWVVACMPAENECQDSLVGTSDGGETWEVLTEAGLPSVYYYHFFNPQDGLVYGVEPAAGTAFWQFLETHDGGVTWAPVTFASSHRSEALDIPGQYTTCNICYDALHLDQERLIIVGGNLAQEAADAIPIWVTFDRGETWHESTLPLPAGVFGYGWFNPLTPVFPNDDFGILAVRVSPEDQSGIAIAFYASTDGGLSWEFRSLVDTTGSVAGWSRLVVASDQDIFIPCGSDLCASHDGAWTWMSIETNFNFDSASGVEPSVVNFTFLDAQTGWALTEADEVTTLWRTRNGGESWTLLEPEFSP